MYLLKKYDDSPDLCYDCELVDDKWGFFKHNSLKLLDRINYTNYSLFYVNA